jgi:putative transposase
VAGVRFEVPARFAHLPRLTIRYARWDLASVLVCDRRTGEVIGTLHPIDKARNAEGVRRPRSAPDTAAPLPATGIAPLLQTLLEQYRASGLPPAYQPKDEKPPDQED